MKKKKYNGIPDVDAVCGYCAERAGGRLFVCLAAPVFCARGGLDFAALQNARFADRCWCSDGGGRRYVFRVVTP